MDTTYDRDSGVEASQSGDDEVQPLLDSLGDVEPSQAPAVAEKIADRLAIDLEEAGAVLDPVQLPLGEE